MKVYISAIANNELKDYLVSTGIKLIPVGPKGNVAEPIACHPDIYYCSLGEKAGLYKGDPGLLGPEYPADVLYNAAAVGKYFICSKFTSEKLTEAAEAAGLRKVLVPQGYVKCSLAVVCGSMVITEDAGIARVLRNKTDIQCLNITPGYVKLPGYKYGFIGGCSGRIGDTMIFNGNLADHPDFEAIRDFVLSAGLQLKYFESYPLTDIGSIICENLK